MQPRTRDRWAVLWVLTLALGAPAQDGGMLRGGLFSLPRSQDDTAELDLAQKDLEAARFADAVERLQKLVLRGGNGIVPAPGATPGKLSIGARLAAITRLRELDERGKEAYEKLVQRDAGALLRIPFAELSATQLATLAEEFPTSRPGHEARLRLGDLALEAGEGLAAAAHYRAAADALPADDPRRASLAQRRATARALLGSTFAVRRGENAFPPRSDLERSARAQIEPILAEPPNERIGWPSFGGGGAGLSKMERPLGKTKVRPEWQLSAPGFQSSRPPMHLVGGLGGLYVNDGQSLWCLDPLTGQIRWRGEGPMVDASQREVEEYEDGISEHMVLAAALDEDVAVVALQVPNELEGAAHRMQFSRFNVMSKIPSRRLFAFDRATGKRLWAHWDQKGGTLTSRYAGHDAAGPPMIVGGETVFLATHDPTGAIQYYLSAYDLLTGKPKWRRLICSSQLEVNMFGNARNEFAAAPLAYEDGVVYATTNLGVCYAADAESGRIRWISAYDVIPMPQTQLTNQQERPVYFANNPAVILDGVFVCTPVDSAFALGFDTETGKLLWKFSHDAPAGGVENQIHCLLGALGDEVIFSGRGLVAVQAHPETTRSLAQARLIASPEMLGTSGRHPPSIPRGALTADRIWFPSPTGLRVVDREGVLDPRALEIEAPGSGNLLLQDGILATARLSSIEVHLDRESLLLQAEARTKATPDDALAWLNLASMVLATGPGETSDAVAERAEACYRKGLEAVRRTGLDSASPLGKRLSEGLFRLTFARAEAAAKLSAGAALPLLRKARDEAPDANSWIGAQVWILRLVERERKDPSSELQLLVEKHGDVLFTFPEAGRIPVRAYALWRSVDHQKSPETAALACQELLERYPELTIAGERVRDYVARRLGALLASHGKDIYRAIEQRAGEALARARADKGAGTSALWWVVETYPHSEAARVATLEVLDDALAKGDAGQALRIYGSTLRSGRLDARHLRRAIAAAQAIGNTGLVARLVAFARAQHRGEATEFAADAGKTIDVAVPPPDVRPAVTTLPGTPKAVMARLPAPDTGPYRQRLVEVFDAAGFGEARDALFLVYTSGDRLAAYDLARGAATFDTPRFETGFAPPTETPLVWRCGDRFLLVESQRIRALLAKDGTEAWTLDAPEHRTFRCLGIHGGLARIWSEAQDIEDGGQVLAVEPQSGAILARTVFDPARPSTAPLYVEHEIRALHLDGSGLAVLRYDDLTGAELAAIRPSRQVQERLGLKEATMARARVEDLARRWFSDGSVIYLPGARASAAEAPYLAAVDLEGKEVWSWTGNAGRSLDAAGVSGERLVIVEGSGDRGGRVLVVDRKEHRIDQTFELEGRVRTIGWSSPQRMPRALFVTDTAPKVRLLCVPLAPGLQWKPFQQDIGRGATDIWQNPVLGADALVLPLRTQNNRSINLVALDLDDERKELLGAFGSKAGSGLMPPYQLGAAGPYIAMLSDREITLFWGGAAADPSGVKK